MANNTLLVIACLMLGLFFIFVLARSRLGKHFISALVLRLPFFNNIARQSNSAMILRSISSLVSSGVSMTKTIEITTQVVQNYYYKQVLAEALVKVQKGLPLSAVLSAHQNLFPIFAGEMAAVGEETGRLADLLLKGAEFFEGEVDQVTKNLSTIIEPALMVLIGMAVGFFAISMIGPMYSLSNAIK